MRNLKHLLQFHSKKEFFSFYFEKQHLYISSSEVNNSNLFSFKDLDETISTHQISYPFLKLFKDGTELPRQYFEKESPENGQLHIDLPKAIDYFSKGYSLILNRIDRLSTKLSKFSRGLEFDLKMRVESNLYLTPADNYGFDIHFDAHDVFVIQLEGSKVWTLYESEIPLITEGLRVPKKPKDSFIENTKYKLQKGDVLYIPRGTYHQAKSTDETSMHLTVGLHPLLGHQLINQLASKAQEELFFRKSVPAKSASKKEKQEYYQLFAKKIIQFLNPIKLEEFSDRKRVQLLKEQDLNYRGVLLNQLNADSLNQDSIVKMRDGLIAELKEVKRILKIVMPRQIIDVPIFLKPLIVRLLNSEEIIVSDIKEMGSPEKRNVLLKRLIAQGFLEVVASK